MMPETGTIEKITRLAERRQALWNKAPALTAIQRAEISRLTADLEALWEQHRIELARPKFVSRRRPARAGTSSTRRRTAA
jgi:hypothetical protein